MKRFHARNLCSSNSNPFRFEVAAQRASGYCWNPGEGRRAYKSADDSAGKHRTKSSKAEACPRSCQTGGRDVRNHLGRARPNYGNNLPSGVAVSGGHSHAVGWEVRGARRTAQVRLSESGRGTPRASCSSRLDRGRQRPFRLDSGQSEGADAAKKVGSGRPSYAEGDRQGQTTEWAEHWQTRAMAMGWQQGADTRRASDAQPCCGGSWA
jgi:hypothetical protein